jgi:hypothetical protein
MTLLVHTETWLLGGQPGNSGLKLGTAKRIFFFCEMSLSLLGLREES